MPNSLQTIAFLPGASGRGDFWEPVGRCLTGYEQIYFDWPGFGDVPAEPYVHSYVDLSSIVIERLQHKTVPSIVVAQSMGGVVAVDVATRRPDLVSHLVLGATSGGIDVAALGAIDWRPGSRSAHPTNPSWMWDEPPDQSVSLTNLKVPTLLVWASDDSISPHAVGLRLAELIPDSRLLVFAGDDHWVARINAEAVACEIDRLARSPRR